jgi:hypothetical protein
MLVESLLSRRAFESGASGWRGGAKLVAEVYKKKIYIYIIYISVSILAQVSSNGISKYKALHHLHVQTS